MPSVFLGGSPASDDTAVYHVTVLELDVVDLRWPRPVLDVEPPESEVLIPAGVLTSGARDIVAIEVVLRASGDTSWTDAVTPPFSVR